MSTVERMLKSAELTRLTETRWGPKRHWRCVYCGRMASVVDHLLPTAMGGTDDRWNLVPACLTCNARKMDRDPWYWMAAVGVPLSRELALRKLIAEPDLIPPPLPRDRFWLDYGPGAAIPRSGRAEPGQKGK